MTMQNAAGRCDPVRGVVLAVLFIPQSDAPRTTTASWPYRAPRTGDAAFDQAWARDRSLDGTDALRYALGEARPAHANLPGPAAPVTATKKEKEE